MRLGLLFDDDNGLLLVKLDDDYLFPQFLIVCRYDCLFHEINGIFWGVSGECGGGEEGGGGANH